MDKHDTPQILGMNIELTTACPLHCPQCYCSLEGGRHIPLSTVITRLQQAQKMGVQHVELSGGETMCYPHLFEVIRAAKERGIAANVALSGFGLNQETYEMLLKSGVHGIYISLNGSTKEINSLSRDGFELAISALELLKENNYPNTTLNWVMHSNNADDFPNIVALTEKYNISSLVVLGVKPDSKHMLSTIPTSDQMRSVSNFIRTYHGKTRLIIESCYSPLLALTSDTRLFGNLNVGVHKGCRAGRSTLSLNVDGMLSPCRHLDYFEQWDTLEEYWNNSQTLQMIRTLEEYKREPCLSCKFCNYCRHCLSINSKLNGDLYIGNEYCPLASKA